MTSGRRIMGLLAKAVVFRKHEFFSLTLNSVENDKSTDRQPFHFAITYTQGEG